MKIKIVAGIITGCIAMSMHSTAMAGRLLELGITSPSGCILVKDIYVVEAGGPKFQVILGEMIGKTLLYKSKCPDAHITVNPLKKIILPPIPK